MDRDRQYVPATFSDYCALRGRVSAEIGMVEFLEGELLSSKRYSHAQRYVLDALESHLTQIAEGAFLFKQRPELADSCLEPTQVLRPALAAWGRHAMTEPQFAEVCIDVRPDWVCEVVARGLARNVFNRKLDVYARRGILYVWLVNCELRHVQVLTLLPRALESPWAVTDNYFECDYLRAEPFRFDQGFHLGEIWADEL